MSNSTNFAFMLVTERNKANHKTDKEVDNKTNSKIIDKPNEKNQVECQGCIENQPNQLAHMDPYGCLGNQFEDN